MKQADKSDKSYLPFGSSTSDDEKIIKVVDHSMKTAASHHANNSVRGSVKNRWGAKETERESVIHVIVVAGRILCPEHPTKTLYFFFFFFGGGGGGGRGAPGASPKLTRYKQSSENSSEKKTTPRCQLS